jgi:thiosulfate dehydrogenase
MRALTWRAAALVTLGAAIDVCSPLRAAELPAPPSAAVCAGCHGAKGEGNAAAIIPRLAGQSAEYLDKELKDYATGSRENPIMQNFAKALSDADRKAVALYFESLNAPYVVAHSTANPAQLARGHQLAHQGAEAKRVQACNSCHGPDGMGVAHAAPYLAGQSSEYLASALKSFQNGTRKNDPGKLMSSVAERLDDADITDAAAYFSSLAASLN